MVISSPTPIRVTMSGSETGLIAGREAYGLGLERGPNPSQPAIQNMGMGFIAPTSSPFNNQSITAGGDGSTVGGTGANMITNLEPLAMKKKRGRPRKYSPNGNGPAARTHTAGGVNSPPPPPRPHAGAAVASAAPAASPSGRASPSSSSLKKARGRPRGSGNKHQMEGLGSGGLGFTPHVISVKAGEDVQAKIMSFSQHGPRAVCILTANGTISNVTLRQPATSGGTVTYEGRFEILSLSGSFLLSENGGQRSRTGGISVSLAGPDGRVLGGGVAGLLTAAAPVQVVMGSFIPDARKDFNAANQVEPLSVTPKLPTVTGATRDISPPFRGTHSESSGEGSPLNHGIGAYNGSNPGGMSAMPWK